MKTKHVHDKLIREWTDNYGDSWEFSRGGGGWLLCGRPENPGFYPELNYRRITPKPREYEEGAYYLAKSESHYVEVFLFSDGRFHENGLRGCSRLHTAKSIENQYDTIEKVEVKFKDK